MSKAGDNAQSEPTPWRMRIRDHVAKVYHRFGKGSCHDPRELLALQFAVKWRLLCWWSGKNTIAAVGDLTLAIVGDNYHNLGAVHIDGGLDRGGQFTIRGRKKMVSGIDDGELCMRGWKAERLAIQ